jgi:hypothetical protein
MAEDDKLARIVEARLKLRERFQRETAATPSLSDDAPEGTGPTQPPRHAAAAARSVRDQEVAGARSGDQAVGVARARGS